VHKFNSALSCCSVTPFISVDVARAGSSVNSSFVCGMSSENSFLGGVEGASRRFMSTLCGRFSMSSSVESILGLIVFVVSGGKSFSSKLLLVMSSVNSGIRICNEAFVLLLRFSHSLSGCLHCSFVLFFSRFSFSMELCVALTCHCFLMLSCQVSFCSFVEILLHMCVMLRGGLVVFHSLLIISSCRGQSGFGSEVSLSFLFTVVIEILSVTIVLSLRGEEFMVVSQGV